MNELIPIPVFAAFAFVWLFGKIFETVLPYRWWALRLGMIPMLCFGLAAFLTLNPPDTALNNSSITSPNAGRAQFFSVFFFGLFLPSAYLFVMTPILLIYAVCRHRSHQD